MRLFKDNETNNNMVKNSNWQEANQLDILQAIVAEDLNSGLPRTNPASGRSGLELGASELQVQRSNRSATPPPSWL